MKKELNLHLLKGSFILGLAILYETQGYEAKGLIVWCRAGGEEGQDNVKDQYINCHREWSHVTKDLNDLNDKT